MIGCIIFFSIITIMFILVIIDVVTRKKFRRITKVELPDGNIGYKCQEMCIIHKWCNMVKSGDNGKDVVAIFNTIEEARFFLGIYGTIDDLNVVESYNKNKKF